MKHHLARLLRGLADRIDPPKLIPICTYGENGTFTASSGSNYRLTFLK